MFYASHYSAVCNILDPVIVLAGIILYMRPANGRQRYNVMSSLIGWVHMQNDLCIRLEQMHHVT